MSLSLMGLLVQFRDPLKDNRSAFPCLIATNSGTPIRGVLSKSAIATWRIPTTAVAVCFYLIIFCSSHVGSVAQLPESEYLALYDLYNATNGAEWAWSESTDAGVPWEFGAGADPCGDQWQGVNCTADNAATYHVVKLQLDNTNLQGYLPDSLVSLGDLHILSLSNNRLIGGIPPTFCDFRAMMDLSLGYNALSGAIPACIGQLLDLQYLYLEFNRLNGEIPSSIGNLTQLVGLFLHTNEFSGPLPASIGNLTQLMLFAAHRNKFTGHIPPSVGKLSNLLELSLALNKLSGPLPESLYGLTHLMGVFLEGNQLSGSIFASIGDLTQLVKLALQRNHLTGSLPSTIGNLAHLQWLFLYRNKLTGAIPNTIGNLVQLLGVSMENNNFGGQIPTSVGNLQYLMGLSLHHCLLTGPLPSSLGNLKHLIGLNLYSNQLTGTLPDSLGQLTQLLEVFLEHNLFTGWIPSSLGNWANVLGMSLEGNQLSGPLPDSIGNLTQVLELTLFGNRLTGYLPTTVGNLKNLTTFSLEGNRLSGPLSGRFRVSQSRLLSIQLDDNQFTGELPADLFELPALASLSLVGSCLHGSLPDNICGATQLEALIVYGLTTGSSCRATGVQSLSAYRSSFAGPFPSCLLALPNLVTLLMSSNGLTGTIPSNVIISQHLYELDLCHNDLSGSIPSSIQNHTWELLDLSHNKFSGVLHSNLLRPGNLSVTRVGPHLTFTIHPHLHPVVSLESNRLSGPVPNSLKPLHNLTVIAGNLFNCKLDKSDLPQHDEDLDNYECASNTFDIAIYVWLGFGVSAVVLAAWAYQQQLVPSLSSLMQLPDEHSGKLTGLYSLLEEYQILSSAGWWCAAFCLVVLLPYYCIVSHYDGTHTYQYAYVLSAIYVSGVLPFAFDVLLLGALLALVSHGLMSRYKCIVTAEAADEDSQTKWQRSYIWLAFAFINITVVLGANIAFVYVVLYQSSQVQTLAQILLSLFKLVWSMAVSPYLIRQLNKYFNRQNERPAETFFTLQLLVALFNNIAIPCLVVAAIDPNCFSNILLPPAQETVDYLAPQCIPFAKKGACLIIKYQKTTLHFTPPFTYSYQCSASIITSYAPTFIYMSMSTVFLSPLLQYVLAQLYGRLSPDSTAFDLLLWVLPRILKLPTAEPPKSTGRKPSILGGVGIMVTLLTQLGIMLTFGAIFPPVALAMAVSIAAAVFMTRYRARCFVHAAVDRQLPVYLDIINAECERVGSGEQMQTAVSTLVCYSCAFYTLFLFDTLGDAVGFAASAWVLLVMPLSPVVALSAVEMWSKYRTLKQEQAERKGAEVGVELSSVYPSTGQQQGQGGMANSTVRSVEEDASTFATVNVLHRTSV